MNWTEYWGEQASFTLFDSHYDGGAGFEQVFKAWKNAARRPARLHYIALDRHAPMPGFRRIPLGDANVTLDVLGAQLDAPLDAALAELRAHIDLAWLHHAQGDGTHFARALGRLAAPGMCVLHEDLTPAQLRALEAASFTLEANEHARYTSRRPFTPPARAPERRAIVIGAGLAGSAACQRLVARGWDVTIVERHRQSAQEASGNLAGITMPLLSRDDNLMTRAARAAFQYAQDYFDALGGIGRGGVIIGARCGVLQLARDAEHAETQRAIAAEGRYPLEFARWLESGEATALLGAPAPHGAWLFPQGGWANPASVCRAMLDACGAALTRRFAVGDVRLDRVDGSWVVSNQAGVVAEAPVVILASGAGQFSQSAELPLAAVRGQVTHLEAGSVPALPFVLCREAYLTPAQRGLHSAGATYDDSVDASLSEDSQRHNLAKLASMLGTDAPLDAPLAGRVGFRSVAPDRLPLVGALPDAGASTRMERLREVPRHPGLYGLLGYASRGMTWAPLAAELLASMLDGEPLPLEMELVDALDPARFLLRERRRTAS
ncbi:MAG: FAD-dependent 5-carboxymethylaminomethyl-2-thiouridine(34) oxidoreductase MnmC [Gammaproteobacteria bacterium]